MNGIMATRLRSKRAASAALLDVAVASIEAMDAAGMTLAVSLGPGQRSVRIAFDHVLQDTDDARRTLIAMAGIGADAHL